MKITEITESNMRRRVPNRSVTKIRSMSHKLTRKRHKMREAEPMEPNALRVDDKPVMKSMDTAGNEFDVNTDPRDRNTGTVVKDKNGSYVVREPGRNMTGDRPVEPQFKDNPTMLQQQMDKQKKELERKVAARPTGTQNALGGNS